MVKSRQKRITQAEKDTRVHKVMDLISKGLTRADILQYATEKTEWKVADRTIDDYIKAAREQFALDSKVEKDEMRGILTRTLFDVLKATSRVQDYQRVISAVAKLIDLHGLEAEKAPQRIVVEHIQSKVDALIQRAGGEEKAAALLAALLEEIPNDYVQ